MDPTYAPAWQELGVRSYYDATYSDGGEKMMQQSNDAYARALQLDPNLTVALGQQITNAVERGELGKAYLAAEALVKDAPKAPSALRAELVFRYAGMLEQSAAECDRALSLDPGNYMFRSCAWTFMELGQTERAVDFLQLALGRNGPLTLRLRCSCVKAKLRRPRKPPNTCPPRLATITTWWKHALGCDPPASRTVLPTSSRPTRPMNSIRNSCTSRERGWACGKNQDALQLLQSAVERSYCAYSNLLNDPMLAKLRANEALNKVFTEASACQDAVKSLQAQQGK